MVAKKAYFDPYPSPGLYPSFVLYADILGFTEMVRSADASDHLADLQKALKAAKSQTLESGLDQPYRVSAFSDNIVLGWPVSDENRNLADLEPLAGTILLHAAYFQLEMALHGFFVRGGLTWGELYMQEDLIFGAGLVDAYELELAAIFPRILVDAPIPKLGTEIVRNFGGDPFAIIFADDIPSVDYLDVLNDAEDDVPALLGLHKSQVERALASTTEMPRYHEKHEWTAAYHNFNCQQKYGETELTIRDVPDRWHFERLSKRLFDQGLYRPNWSLDEEDEEVEGED